MMQMRAYILERAQRSLVHFLHIFPALMRQVPACPVCGGSSEFEHKNRLFQLNRCTACGHVYTGSVPSALLSSWLYSGLFYWKVDKEHQGIHRIELTDEWDGFIKPRIEILEKAGLPPMAGKMADVYEIGCSEGILLAELTRRGHVARGCELNGHIARKGSSALGVDIALGSFESVPVPYQAFDYVISFHTLEHIADISGVLEKICRILRDDGCLVVEVPGGEEEYENLDHLHFFSRKSLALLFSEYFREYVIIDNVYTNSAGVSILSYYGIGKQPIPR